MEKLLTLLCTIGIFSCLANAQEINPVMSGLDNKLSVSVATGLPRIAGIETEYTHKLSGKKQAIGFNVDLSYLPNIFPASKTSTTYLGLGCQWYPWKNGHGLYTGLQYGLLGIDATQINSRNTDLHVRFNWIGPKVGIKAGKQVFFQFELGYSLIFFNIDDTNDFLRETYDLEVHPTRNYLHLPNFSLGLGYTFVL